MAILQRLKRMQEAHGKNRLETHIPIQLNKSEIKKLQNSAKKLTDILKLENVIPKSI